MPEVVFNKSRDEIVAVVVTVVHPQLKGQTAFGTGCYKKIRLQLLSEIRIIRTLIHENCRAPGTTGYVSGNFAGVVLVPGRLFTAKKIAQRFLTPY